MAAIELDYAARPAVAARFVPREDPQGFKPDRRPARRLPETGVGAHGTMAQTGAQTGATDAE